MVGRLEEDPLPCDGIKLRLDFMDAGLNRAIDDPSVERTIAGLQIEVSRSDVCCKRRSSEG